MTKLIKCTIFTAIITMAVLSMPGTVTAQYGQYGQGQVLGDEAPVEIVHKPGDVKAGITDDPRFLGGMLLAVSGALFAYSKRNRNVFSKTIS